MLFKTNYFFFILCFSLFLGLSVQAQQLISNSGFVLKASLQLGNQNQSIKLGVYGVASIRYGDIAFESGLSLIGGQLFKRHTAKVSGLFYGYDVFLLGGLGKNDNLLVSSLFGLDRVLIFDASGANGFKGLGFGFQKEFLPKSLKLFNIRRGKFLMRFSNAQHSINMSFTNDFKFGRLFNGEGTDFGPTGSVELSYSRIESPFKAHLLGGGLLFFTPKANVALSPNNPINSDDGRKNVWYTHKPHSQLFYANAYAFGSYQASDFAVTGSLGINSQKLGAYIQNTLHDGVGLNPRFPWDVTAKDQLFFELDGSVFKSTKND